MAQFKLKPIDRIEDITKDDFIKNYYKPQRPVLFENLTKNWDAYHKWDLDYIQSLAEDQVVHLYNNQETKGKQKSAVPATHMKLYDYIEILKTQPTDLRIIFFDVMKKMPVLIKDFKYPALKHVEGFQVEMKHGDALYMLSGYWHFVEYLDDGFSMTLRPFKKAPGCS